MSQKCRAMIPAQAPETRQSKILFKKEWASLLMNAQDKTGERGMPFHPVYGSEDMEGLRRCVLIDLEDCITKDRETGEKGEALCMMFQNEEGKYINVSYLDGQLSMSSPYRK